MTLPIVLAALLAVVPPGAASSVQTDWSAGGGEAGPVSAWAGTFAESTGVSWLAEPGQLALAGEAVAGPTRREVGRGLDGALKVWAGDVDGDGDTDVLAATYYGSSIELFSNQGGDPVQWTRQSIVANFTHAVALAAADVDGDGRLDVLGGADDISELDWWRNLGGDPVAWERHTVASGFRGTHDVAGADLDSDGDLDLVAVAYEDDEVAWWRSDGGDPPAFTPFLIAAGFDYACNLAVADVDSDGDPDVVATAWLDQRVAWWRNDGGDPLEWTRQDIAEGFAGTHWVEAADVDRDGRVDVLAAAMDRGEIAWWRNRGGDPVLWERHPVTTLLPGAVSVSAADLDGDGDLDVAGSGWSPSGGVAWWENLSGAGLDWRRHTVDGTFGESSSVHVADVDSDGALDLLASSWSLERVAWWRVTRFRPEGTLTSSILDTGENLGWTGWMLDATTPPGTVVRVEARTGDEPGALGPWVGLDPGGPVDPLGAGDRYLQYRLTLSSSDPERSPVVRAIGFEWRGAAPPPRRPRGRFGRP